MKYLPLLPAENILYTKVFGTTSFSLTVEGMGPYPLSDSTNLLGPTSTSYASRGGVGVGVVGSSACYTNYGTNIQTPVPNRKQCYYNESDYGRDDTFRRHSAHGRMSCRFKQSNSLQCTVKATTTTRWATTSKCQHKIKHFAPQATKHLQELVAREAKKKKMNTHFYALQAQDLYRIYIINHRSQVELPLVLFLYQIVYAFHLYLFFIVRKWKRTLGPN